MYTRLYKVAKFTIFFISEKQILELYLYFRFWNFYEDKILIVTILSSSKHEKFYKYFVEYTIHFNLLQTPQLFLL